MLTPYNQIMKNKVLTSLGFAAAQSALAASINFNVSNPFDFKQEYQIMVRDIANNIAVETFKGTLQPNDCIELNMDVNPDRYTDNLQVLVFYNNYSNNKSFEITEEELKDLDNNGTTNTLHKNIVFSSNQNID